MLVGSDGYEYEDLKARLLGQRLENSRNRAIRLYRNIGYTEAGVKVWWETYDSCIKQGYHHDNAVDLALNAAYGIDGFGVVRHKSRNPGRTR